MAGGVFGRRSAGCPSTCSSQGPKQHRGAVVASCLPHRHGHHSRCPGLPADAWALQRLQPRKKKAVLIHALDGSGRNGLHLSVRVLGQDDIHGMGLIKGLHHLDAIAQ